MVIPNNCLFEHNIWSLGFTGRRNGYTPEQLQKLKSTIRGAYNLIIAHHGMCMGADCEFAQEVRRHVRCHIVGHPCNQVDSQVTDTERCPVDSKTEVLTAFARNRAIVQASSSMIACPPTMTDPGKGGTWYTINYAKKMEKPLLVIYPDGSTEYFNL